MATDISRDFDYTERPRHTPGWQLAIDIGETIVLTLIMFLVIRMAVQDYQVDGTSMLPTLQNTQFVLVDKLTYDFSAPQRGDIIVFEYPRNHAENYIKRIIGIPGDHIFVSSDGYVTVNGMQLQEPYVNDLDNPYGPESFVLETNQYFVLGDNRGGSSDSREWGTVNRSEIIGKATLVYWPAAAIHLLPNNHATFQNVPAPNNNDRAPTSSTPQGVIPASGTDPFAAGLLMLIVPCAGGVVRATRKQRRG